MIAFLAMIIAFWAMIFETLGITLLIVGAYSVARCSEIKPCFLCRWIHGKK